ncbi:MAG: O-antigen ligase family protein [Endomicrobium sp.]|jgi:O-antigen ligase|nr:O-antigen ligase family protein [Endomicrobium sp.]
MPQLFNKTAAELKKNDLSFYCALFVVAVSFGSGFVFSLNAQFICFTVLALSFSYLFVKKSLRPHSLFLAFLPLAAVFLSYTGADFQTNVRTSSLVLINAVLAFFIVSYSKKRTKENLVATFIIIGLWISFLLFVQRFSDFSATSNQAMLNINTAAGFLLLIYPLCFAFSRENQYFPLFLLAAFIIFTAIILTKARAASVIAYAVTLFYFISFKNVKFFRAFFILVSSVFIAGVIYAFYVKAGWDSFSDRLIWQKTAFLMFKDSSLFGVGFGNFSALFLAYRPEASLNTLFAHNIALQLLAETGIFGILSFAVFAFAAAKRAIVSFKNSAPDSVYIRASAVGVTAFMFLNMCDYSFFIPANALVFFIMAAIACNAAAQDSKLKAVGFVIFVPAVFFIYVFFNPVIAYNYYRQGNYLKALQYDSKNPDYLFNFYEIERGLAEEKGKDWQSHLKAAKQYALEAEKYYRHSAQIKFDIAYLYRISGDREQFLKYLKLAQEADKFNPFYRLRISQ